MKAILCIAILLLIGCAARQTPAEKLAYQEAQCTRIDLLGTNDCIQRARAFEQASKPLREKYALNSKYCRVMAEQTVTKPTNSDTAPKTYTWNNTTTGESGTLRESGMGKIAAAGTVKPDFIARQDYEDALTVVTQQCMADRGWERGSLTLREQLLDLGKTFGLDVQPVLDAKR